MQDNTANTKWYKRRWVWVLVIAVVVFLMIGAFSDDPNKQQAANNTEDTTKDAADSTTKPDAATKPAPRFAGYIGKSMTDVAKEFGQTYDAANSTQIDAEKDGYKLHFEDGGRITDITKENTGNVNIAYVELSSMGKCEQGQVYNKIDEAMQLTGLTPSDKGTKHEDMGGTQQGYGAYRDYKGDETLELALLCDYDGDNYKLQLRVLPEFR